MWLLKALSCVSFLSIPALITFSQTGSLAGKISSSDGSGVNAATIHVPLLKLALVTDSSGLYELKDIPYGKWELTVSAPGFQFYQATIQIQREYTSYDITLNTAVNQPMEEVVVSGTLKAVSKSESPVPVEVYTSKFLRANPTASIFDALQTINGVRPQINCNICNTGDIRINGLEGPYTMILIDGMPIVSGLSTVYGLNGIPQALIERVEIVKGPASTLYGSEAIGGLVNIITQKPTSSPLLSVDVFSTTWQEINADIGFKLNVNEKAQSLFGINYFNYQHPVDNNNDNFTDLTLQNRISVFNKWSFERASQRLFSLAARYVYEDRWGGEMNWTKSYRGGDEIYGESIYTRRWELLGSYQLPFKESVMLMFSINSHQQNSAYGDMFFLADQHIGFAQLTWNKQLNKHDMLSGIAYRYTYYDDNTVATARADDARINQSVYTHLPGLFLQDEISLAHNSRLLLGIRYDYNSLHGSILTPRANYKWTSADKRNILRVSIGNGYRIANVFTEDHAALTGARSVIFMEDLKPETSWNTNINFTKKIYSGNTLIGIDATLFYTYFSNKIIADYDTDPDKIIYSNLSEYAISKGASLNIDLTFSNSLRALLGVTAMDVYSKEESVKIRQLFSERFNGVWNISYTISTIGLSIDYTGNLYGPMRLPLLSDLDPRKEYSPWWSVQNVQLTKKFRNHIEIYGGVKNILNWTINKGAPFIIARANDPFDKNVIFDTDGRAMVTPDNPYGLTFDPSYAYGPNQGIRGFLGFRYSFNR